MKALTISNNSALSKKKLLMIAGIVSVLAIAGLSGLFYSYQKTSSADEKGPANIKSTPAETKASIRWETPKDAIAVIEYGPIPDPVSFKSRIASQTPSKEHSVELADLKPNTTYYFQIKIGDETFDNGGQYYAFHTEGNAASPTTTQSLTPSASVSISPSWTATPSALASITPDDLQETHSPSTPSATLSPVSSPTHIASISATLSPRPLPSAINTPTPAPLSCVYTDCALIQRNLGTRCTSQDYIKCIIKITNTPTPTRNTTPTTTPTRAPTSSSTTSSDSSASKTSCAIDYLQANSCRSFSWNAMALKGTACTDSYKKYFVQCKNTSWTSTDASIWYCNQTTTATDITVPCGTAPTPIPGQSIFCRVRAETENGGSTNATDWIYSNTSCATLSSSMSQCAMNYIQSNNCKSWSWDNVALKNPVCAAGLDHYFLQCTSNGDFSGSTGTWHCNKTFTDPLGDFPCYGAPTPADGSSLTCRVRAEDAYGTDSHATSWVSATGTCPTSTPTPTFTPSPTFTNTPTPTNTHTPTPTP